MTRSPNYLIMPGLLAMLIIISFSCKKTVEHLPPDLVLVEENGYIFGDTILSSGSDIRLKVLMQGSDLNITNFLIEVYSDSVSRYFDTGMNTSYFVWEGIFIKTLAPVEDWNFIVRDSEGNAASTSIKISLDTNAQYTPLVEYGPVEFGAQDNQQSGGCFDIANNMMYFYQVVDADTSLQAGIDMLCFYDDIDKNTIASPGANIEDGIFPTNPANWESINTTRYMKTSLAADDFNNAINDSIIIANYDEGEAKRKAKKLKLDDIYTFRTQEGRLGIFKVNAVNGAQEGSVNISLKTQP